MFLDSLAVMTPRWGCSSSDARIYKHFAPLELAEGSIRRIQRQWRSGWSPYDPNKARFCGDAVVAPRRWLFVEPTL
jgi:hypothetical protein